MTPLLKQLDKLYAKAEEDKLNSGYSQPRFVYSCVLQEAYPALRAEIERLEKELEIADERWKRAEDHHKRHEDEMLADVGGSKRDLAGLSEVPFAWATGWNKAVDSIIKKWSE